MRDPFAAYFRSLNGDTRRDWSDLDGPPPEPNAGPDPFAYPLPPAQAAPQQAQSPVAATKDPQAAIRSESTAAPVLEPHSEPRAWEPCDRCGERAYAPNRRDGRLLCSECDAVVWRLGDSPPVDDATGLRLLIRSLRNRGKP